MIELYDDVVPKTAANFKALCTGEQKDAEKNLHFLNMIFHRGKSVNCCLKYGSCSTNSDSYPIFNMISLSS